jgi:aminoglycoside 6'-N-acetyltransferase
MRHDERMTSEEAVVRPLLVGKRVTLRPGREGEAQMIHRIRAEPSVTCWWGEPEPLAEIAQMLAAAPAPTGEVMLIVEVDRAVAGAIQYAEENEPNYRHAGIDIFLSADVQGKGIGSEAVWLLARFLIDQRRHHRLTIDPAAANQRAIRCYERVGFRPVGVLRQYERGPDGTFHDGLLMDLLAAELKPADG